MTESSISKKVGFIGLGKMGTPMVSRLLQAGFEVVAFDLDAFAVSNAVSNGASEASIPAEVAKQCNLIILMLPNSKIVNSVVLDSEFQSSLAPESLIIDMSSSEPLETQNLSATLEAKNIHLVDAPVSGGVKGAVQGTLTIMVGGNNDQVNLAASVLKNLGRVLPVGSIGSGHAIKALNNLLSASHLWATSEVMSAGMKFGLDPKVMLDAFNGASGKSGSTENKWPNFILPGTFNSGFALALMLKDMKIAVKLADSTEVPFNLGNEVTKLWEKAASELSPLADHTEIARWIEGK